MPSVRIPREAFLERLEQLQPGLASREIMDQATCFAFKNGRVYTFNEEIACQADSLLPKEFVGAVQSRPLLDILRRMPEKKIYVSNGSGRLVIEGSREKGKRKRARIILQSKVLLPFEQVEQPDKWHPLSEDFAEAVKIVTAVVKKDASDWMYSCVHIHPEYVEGADGDQCVRYETETGLKKPILVRAKSIRHVGSMNLYRFAETPKWIHFRTKDGVVFSCVRDSGKYELEMDILKERGKATVLPSALAETAKAASTFASESDDKYLRIRLKKGTMTVVGIGDSGDYYEETPIKYTGEKAGFVMRPELLEEIAKTHTSVEITKPDEDGCRRLRVDGGRWIYAASLEVEGEKDNDEAE